VRQNCLESDNLAFEIIDSHRAAKQIGLDNLPDNNSCELLYLQLLATTPPRQQFASEDYRRDYRVSQLRYGLLGLGLFALLGGAIFGSKQLYDTYSLRQEAQTLAASEADLAWRYREILATFPQLGIDNDTLRRVTDRQRELLKQQRRPDGALRSLSRALDEVPNVQLEAIEWTSGDLAPAGNPSAPGKPGLIPSGNSETIVLRGALQLSPTASARQTLATFEHFVELLQVDRSNEVSVLQQPFDIESGRALRGGDAESEGNQPRQFALQIVRKAAP
jgi:Tfp pilus assembly protein PilN